MLAVMSWLNIGSYVVRTVCLIHITHTHFYEFTETRGESMLPTLNRVNDYVHVLKWYKDGRDLKMGDCIVAMKPTDPQSRVCKRITGMEGDLILVDPSQEDDEEASLRNFYQGSKGSRMGDWGQSFS